MAIRLRSKHRHARLSATPLALIDKYFMYRWVLVFILDLRAAFFHVLTSILQVFDFEFKTPRLKRQVTGRLRSRIEMLVPSLHRRREHTHAAPLDALLIMVLAFFPEIRVTGACQHDDMRSRAMTMRLFILADRKL